MFFINYPRSIIHFLRTWGCLSSSLTIYIYILLINTGNNPLPIRIVQKGMKISRCFEISYDYLKAKKTRLSSLFPEDYEIRFSSKCFHLCSYSRRDSLERHSMLITVFLVGAKKTPKNQISLTRKHTMFIKADFDSKLQQSTDNSCIICMSIIVEDKIIYQAELVILKIWNWMRLLKDVKLIDYKIVWFIV